MITLYRYILYTNSWQLFVFTCSRGMDNQSLCTHRIVRVSFLDFPAGCSDTCPTHTHPGRCTPGRQGVSDRSLHFLTQRKLCQSDKGFQHKADSTHNAHTRAPRGCCRWDCFPLCFQCNYTDLVKQIDFFRLSHWRKMSWIIELSIF